MSSTLIIVILCAVSAAVLALAVFSPVHRLGTVLSYIWLAAALPVCYFCALTDKQVFLFYLISGALALGYWCIGGERK